MAEPASTASVSLTALAIAIAGPFAGPYSAILFAALAGSLWPLSMSEGITRAAGAWLMLRCVLTATVLTSIASELLAAQYGMEPTELLSPVAFVISAMGNGWRPILASASNLLASFASRSEGKKND